jgi:hypothetical protein
MGLQKGRTKARETEPVKPVDEKTVNATLPYLPPVVADIARFQRLTGCRPAEVCSIRPVDIDRTADVWFYTPESHKTEHHGRSRVIVIGPKAQSVLLPYLLRDADAFCFSPIDSERKRKETKRAQRKTRVQPSQKDRSEKNAKRKPGEQYTSASYGYAVIRACERAFPPALPLNRREGESVSEWKARLTAKQRDDLRAWNILHRWSPNQLRHAAVLCTTTI